MNSSTKGMIQPTMATMVVMVVQFVIMWKSPLFPLHPYSSCLVNASGRKEKAYSSMLFNRFPWSENRYMQEQSHEIEEQSIHRTFASENHQQPNPRPFSQGNERGFD